MADLRSLFENPGSDPQSLQRLRDRVGEIVSEALARGEEPERQLTPEQSEKLISSLPRLTEAQVLEKGEHDALCPICFTPFAAILEEEATLSIDSPADNLGVTKLAETCGHLFCRRDISKWIHDGHGSCPMCRRSLTGESTDTATQEPTISADDAQLVALVQTASFEVSVNPSTHPKDYDEEDRSEFTGMYS
ncbi:hypothetical protein C8J57DRAFT_1710045 [Mycena rebaudengoi]|nr:hypothetical protein C8J57DRAFT_1710045 [Mycena rebaudengoi]